MNPSIVPHLTSSVILTCSYFPDVCLFKVEAHEHHSLTTCATIPPSLLRLSVLYLLKPTSKDHPLFLPNIELNLSEGSISGAIFRIKEVVDIAILRHSTQVWLFFLDIEVPSGFNVLQVT